MRPVAGQKDTRVSLLAGREDVLGGAGVSASMLSDDQGERNWAGGCTDITENGKHC